MEYSPKTSFIPKQTSGPGAPKQHRSFNVLAFLATVIFLAALALSVGVFFYYEYSKTVLEQKKKELADLRSTFSEGDIESLRVLEQRLSIADKLLNQHLSLSKVFDALEADTEEKAQLISLNFERKPSGGADVEIKGRALTFNTVALQERALSGQRSFKQGSVIFSDLNITPGADGKNDTVTFSVEGQLDTSAVAYTAVADIASSSTDSVSSAEMETQSGTSSVTTP